MSLFTQDETVEDDCDCYYADREPHSERDHKHDCSYARGGAPMGEACGGCYGCLSQQAAYYDNLEKEKTDGTSSKTQAATPGSTDG